LLDDAAQILRADSARDMNGLRVFHLNSREQLKSLVRENLAGLDLVGELLAARRRQAAAEDAA
jgi:hypothetical protein